MDLKELEAMVREDPESDDPFLVYADHLQETGDPRGELIALDRMRMEDPLDSERVRAFGRFVDQHFQALLGDLGDVRSPFGNTQWRLGFIREITIYHPRGGGPKELAAVVDRVMKQPAGRFLQHLTIQPLDSGSYGAVIEAIASEPRPTLRRLRIGPSLGDTIVDAAPLSAACPRLERMALSASRAQLGDLVSQLESLDLVTRDAFGIVRAISGGQRLRSLSLGIDDVGTLLDRLGSLHLPELRHLQLLGRPVPDAATQLLGNFPLLRRLESFSTNLIPTDQCADFLSGLDELSDLKRLRVPAPTGLPVLRLGGVEVQFITGDEDPWDESTDTNQLFRFHYVDGDEGDPDATVYIDDVYANEVFVDPDPTNPA